MTNETEPKTLDEVNISDESKEDIIKQMAQLIVDKDAKITSLKQENEFLKSLVSLKGKEEPLLFPSVQTYPIGCVHQYPNPWFATTPPNCIKCGQPAYNYLTVTCENKNE